MNNVKKGRIMFAAEFIPTSDTILTNILLTKLFA